MVQLYTTFYHQGTNHTFYTSTVSRSHRSSTRAQETDLTNVVQVSYSWVMSILCTIDSLHALYYITPDYLLVSIRLYVRSSVWSVIEDLRRRAFPQLVCGFSFSEACASCELIIQLQAACVWASFIPEQVEDSSWEASNVELARRNSLVLLLYLCVTIDQADFCESMRQLGANEIDPWRYVWTLVFFNSWGRSYSQCLQ